MNMNLKALTKAHPAFDGQITFHMMPYRTLAVDVTLDTLAPGREVTGIQASFALCDALTVAVDFALAEDAPAGLRAFEMYWQERPAAVLDRWQLFVQMLDSDIVNEWWAAYEATRDGAGRVDPEV
jgi:hypothetical protein